MAAEWTIGRSEKVMGLQCTKVHRNSNYKGQAKSLIASISVF